MQYCHQYVTHETKENLALDAKSGIPDFMNYQNLKPAPNQS